VAVRSSEVIVEAESKLTRIRLELETNPLLELEEELEEEQPTTLKKERDLDDFF